MNIQIIIKNTLNQLNSVILGKERAVHDALACLLAGGHLLIEDVPGVGKTTLAQALAHTLGFEFSRPRALAQALDQSFGDAAKPVCEWLLRLERARYQADASTGAISALQREFKRLPWSTLLAQKPR